MRLFTLLTLLVFSLSVVAQDASGVVFQEKTFDELLADAKAQDKLIFIDAYTTWCGPCKMVAPILEELSEEYDGKINIYKVDTEKEQELAAAFAIRSIPSMLFIPMGEQPQMATGAMPKQNLKEIIQQVLKVEE